MIKKTIIRYVLEAVFVKNKKTGQRDVEKDKAVKEIKKKVKKEADFPRQTGWDILLKLKYKETFYTVCST